MISDHRGRRIVREPNISILQILGISTLLAVSSQNTNPTSKRSCDESALSLSDSERQSLLQQAHECERIVFNVAVGHVEDVLIEIRDHGRLGRNEGCSIASFQEIEIVAVACAVDDFVDIGEAGSAFEVDRSVLMILEILDRANCNVNSRGELLVWTLGRHDDILCEGGDLHGNVEARRAVSDDEDILSAGQFIHCRRSSTLVSPYSCTSLVF